MDNLFDITNYPDSEPPTLTAGERWAWKRSDITNAYPTALYTLRYQFIQQDSVAASFIVTAAKTDAQHVVTVPIATTAEYSPGVYEWQAIVVRDSDSQEVVVSRGYLDVKTLTGDTRSWTYRVLVAIRATIEGTATKEDSSYSIAGRSLSRRSISELLELEKEFQTRWDNEVKELDRENGRTVNQRRIYLKMGA